MRLREGSSPWGTSQPESDGYTCLVLGVVEDAARGLLAADEKVRRAAERFFFGSPPNEWFRLSCQMMDFDLAEMRRMVKAKAEKERKKMDHKRKLAERDERRKEAQDG